MGNKFMVACLSLAAFAAMAVVPTFASASPHLTETPNIAVKVGEKIIATNETNITLKTGSGHVTCTKSSLTGTVTKNSGTAIEGNITTASFTNNTGGACTSTFLFNPSFTVDVQNLPYCLSASGAADAFSIRGGECAAAAKNLQFTLTGIFNCTYTAASVTGTHNTKADLTLGVAGQKFTSTSGGLCPAEGTLDGAWNVFTDNLPTETPLIIT